MAIISTGAFVTGSDTTYSNSTTFAISSSISNGNLAIIAVATDNINNQPLSSWSLGGNMITARYWHAGGGTATAAIAFGGGSLPAGICACTEKYNGSTWSSGNVMITARVFISGVGNQNAAAAFGGSTPLVVSCTETYNGTTWSSATGLITARQNLAGAGTQNSAIAISGISGATYYTCTELFNGSTWSNVGAVITPRQLHAGAGTSNDALFIGGAIAPAGAVSTATEKYNGTSWSAVGSMITARYGNSAVGSTSAAGTFNCTAPAIVANTEMFNGVVWASSKAAPVIKGATAAAGTSLSAITFGGQTTPSAVSATTELFSATPFFSTNTISCIRDNNYNNNLFSYAIGGTSSLFNGAVRTMTTQSDGKILIGGDFTTYQNTSASYLIRIDTSGSLDPSFTTCLNGPVYKVLIQPSITGSSSTGVWIAGGNLITARFYAGAAGTQNAALAFGGASPTVFSCTEKYNGSTWSAATAMLTGRQDFAAAGTQNSAIAAGGNTTGTTTGTGITEIYNGTTWSVASSITTTPKYGNRGAGATSDSSLSMTGYTPTATTCVEKFNGISWSTATGTTTSRGQGDGKGIQNSAVIVGSNNTGLDFVTELYNGTSWAAGPNAIATKFAGAGTTTNNGSYLRFTGVNPALNNCVERYNGVTWTSQAGTITVKNSGAGAGTTSAAISIGGANPGASNTTELFTYFPTASINPVWINGPLMSTSRYQLAGAGTQNAALGFGGTNPASSNLTEYFNGVSWLSYSIMNIPKSALAGAGTSMAAIAFGGISGSVISCTETFDGNIWSVGGAMITARQLLAGAGTQNAALGFGGATPLYISCTETYNGSSWSSATAMINVRGGLAGAGTTNAAIGFGGLSGSVFSCTEIFDGSTWSVGGVMITLRHYLAGTGTTNAALGFGGTVAPSAVACTEAYNGSTWSARSSMANTVCFNAGVGTQNAAISLAGAIPAVSTCVQLYANSYNPSLNVSDKILALGNFNSYYGNSYSGSIRLNIQDGFPDLTYNIGTGFNNTVCTAVIQSTSAYTSSVYCVPNAWTVRTATPSTMYSHAAGGTATSTLVTGDGLSPTTVYTYNGLSWSGASSRSQPSVSPGLVAPSSTSAVAMGGVNVATNIACTENYNGSSWSTGGAIISARNAIAGAGTQNAGLIAGGIVSATYCSCVELYNGSTWSSGTALITARGCTQAGGTQNTAIVVSGANGAGTTAVTELYNGTTWSAGGNVTQARYSPAISTAGTQNSMLIAGGGSGYYSVTEAYNGVAWSARSAMITGRANLAGSGTQRAALAIGGFLPAPANFLSCVEFYGADNYYSYPSKIILGGTFTAYSGSTSSGSVRLNNDGLIDSTFNIGSGFSGPTDVRTMAISGSQVIVGGNFTSYSGSTANNIVNINTAGGTISSSYNTGTGFNNAVNSIAIQYDGKILATGNFTSYSGSNINRIARLNINGTIDAPFSASVGTGLNDTGSVICIYPNINNASNIIVGGTFTTYSGSTYNGSVRLNITGTTDQTFNIGSGFNGTTSVNDYLFITASSISSSILVGGGFTSYSSSLLVPQPNRMVLINPSGSIQGSYFGTVWNKIGEFTETNANFAIGTGSYSSGPTIALFSTVATGSISTGTQLRLSTTLPTINKAISGWQFAGPVIFSTGSVSSSTDPTLNPPSMSISGLPGGSQYILFRGISHEGLCTDPYTATPGFTALNIAGTATTYLGAWSTQNPIITARQLLSGHGTSTAALAVGGLNPTIVSCTEAYNGSTWSAVGSLISTRAYHASTGTQNSALAFGGITGSTASNSMEIYNGSTWSTGNSLITARYQLAGVGDASSTVAFGGTPGSGVSTATEIYNGSTWSSGNSMISGRFSLAGAGTSNASLAFGGVTPTTTGITEKYNGSTWSSGNSMNVARQALAGAGTQNSAIGIGGYIASVNNYSEYYNGTTWATSNTLITSRCAPAATGISSRAILFGGATPAIASTTELFVTNTNQNITVAGEFSISGTSDVSAPIYPSGSSASMYYAYYQVVTAGGKTYFILID